jgi:hypothetical protein
MKPYIDRTSELGVSSTIRQVVQWKDDEFEIIVNVTPTKIDRKKRTVTIRLSGKVHTPSMPAAVHPMDFTNIEWEATEEG